MKGEMGRREGMLRRRYGRDGGRNAGEGKEVWKGGK